jgi:hypothetical protein
MPTIVVWLIRFGDWFARFAEWLCDRITERDPVYGFKCWDAGNTECTRIEKAFNERNAKDKLPSLPKS